MPFGQQTILELTTRVECKAIRHSGDCGQPEIIPFRENFIPYDGVKFLYQRCLFKTRNVSKVHGCPHLMLSVNNWPISNLDIFTNNFISNFNKPLQAEIGK